MKGTIKSKEDVERLFSQGRRSTSSSMTIIVAKGSNPNRGRCAFIAGKKLGNAPFRSRCKRVMRVLAKDLGAPWNGYDVIFLARRGVAFGTRDELTSQAQNLLVKLGVVDERA